MWTLCKSIMKINEDMLNAFIDHDPEKDHTTLNVLINQMKTHKRATANEWTQMATSTGSLDRPMSDPDTQLVPSAA